MSQLTALENELMTRDPISQVQRCLSCTRAACVNCVAWNYRKHHETRKMRGRRKAVHAEA